MHSSLEEELGDSLVREGLHELPKASREWLYSKLYDAGLQVGAGTWQSQSLGLRNYPTTRPRPIPVPNYVTPAFAAANYGYDPYGGADPSYGYSDQGAYYSPPQQIDDTIAELQKLQALAAIFAPPPPPVTVNITPAAPSPPPSEPWWVRGEHFLAKLFGMSTNTGAALIERQHLGAALIERQRLGAALIERQGAVREAASTLVNASRRFEPGAIPLGSFDEVLDWGLGVPGALAFGPSSAAVKKYVELQADWEVYHNQGVEKWPDLATDVTEWNQFKSDWDSGAIANVDLSGRLNAEVVRSNRVRATLQEKATGQTVFVQDLPDPTKNIALEDTTPFMGAAAKVDAWAAKTPIVNWATSPSSSPAKAASKVGLLVVAAAGAAFVGYAALDLTKAWLLSRRA